MVLCAAPGCSNRSDRVDKHKRVSFMKFPKDENIQKEWITNIRRVFTITQHSRLCSEHFEDDCWENSSKKKLKDSAIPTLFSFDENVLKRSRKIITFKSDEPKNNMESSDCGISAETDSSFLLQYNNGLYTCDECQLNFDRRNDFQEHIGIHIELPNTGDLESIYIATILNTLGPNADDQTNLIFNWNLAPIIKTINVRNSNEQIKNNHQDFYSPLFYVLKFSLVDDFFFCRMCEFQTNCPNRASFHCFRNMHTIVGDFNEVVCKKCLSENAVALITRCNSMAPLMKYLKSKMNDSPTNIIASHTALPLSLKNSKESPIIQYILNQVKPTQINSSSEGTNNNINNNNQKSLADIVEKLQAKANVLPVKSFSKPPTTSTKVHSRKLIKPSRNTNDYYSNCNGLINNSNNKNNKTIAQLTLLEKALIDGVLSDNDYEPAEKIRKSDDKTSCHLFVCSKCPFKIGVEKKSVIYQHIMQHNSSKVKPPKPKSLRSSDNGYFACGENECLLNYQTFSELSNHFSNTHKDESTFQCFYCSEKNRFTLNDLQTHLEKHEYKIHFGLFRCSLTDCKFGYFCHQIEDLKSHLTIKHETTKKFICDRCQLTYNNVNDFIQHIQESIVYKLDCPHCEYECHNYNLMNLHYKHSHNDLEKQNAIVGSELVCSTNDEYDNYYDDMDYDNDSEEVDDTEFVEKIDHSLSDEDIREHTENIKSFVHVRNNIDTLSESTLNDSKTGKFRLKVYRIGDEWRIDCGLCGTTFIELREAMKHCDESHPVKRLGKPCSKCGFSHADKTKIQEHMRWHRKERDDKKRFQCDHCPFSVEQSSFLKCHLFHHSEHGSVLFVYRCRYCTISSNVKSIIEDHIRNAHPLKNPCYDTIEEVINPKDFYCSFCGGYFSNLIRHVKKVHDTDTYELYTKEFCTNSKNKYKLIPHGKDLSSNFEKPEELEMETVVLKPMDKKNSSISLLFNKRVKIVTYNRQSEWNEGPINEAFIGRLGQMSCQFCEFSSSHLGNFAMHLLREMKDSGKTLEVRIFKCANCSFRAMLPTALKDHHYQRHNRQTFGLIPQDICVSDGRGFEETESLCDNVDIKTDGLKRQHSFNSSMSNYSTSKMSEKSLTQQCPLCNFESQLLKNMRRHIEREHKRSVLMYSCRFCSSFKDTQPAAISQHMLDCHPGYPNYLCDIIINSVHDSEPSKTNNIETSLLQKGTLEENEDMNLIANRFVNRLPISFVFDKPISCPFCSEFTSSTRADVMCHINNHVLNIDDKNVDNSYRGTDNKLNIDWDNESDPGSEIAIEEDGMSSIDFSSDEYQELSDSDDGDPNYLENLNIDEIVFEENSEENVKYRCIVCKLETKNKNFIFEHVCQEHLKRPIFVCPYCDTKENSIKTIRHHVRRMHRYQDFKICVLTKDPEGHFISYKMKKPSTIELNVDDTFLRDRLHRNILEFSDTTNGTWKCKICYKLLKTHRRLRRHILGEHTSIRPVQCGHCSNKFVDVQAACEHIFKTHNVAVKQLIRLRVNDNEIQSAITEQELNSKIPQNNSASSSNGNEHTKKLHCCMYCKLVSKWSANDLRVHVYHKHMGKYQFKCTFCDYGSRTTRAVSAHIEREHGAEFKSCVKDNSYLMNLSVQVLKEKKLSGGSVSLYYGPKEGYDGPIAESKRLSNSILSRTSLKNEHSENHDNFRKEFESNTEENCLDSESDCNTKISEKENGRCQICDKVVTWSFIRSHVMGHLNYKPYKCPVCDFSETCNISVRKHILSTHTDDVDQEVIFDKNDDLEDYVTNNYEKLSNDIKMYTIDNLKVSPKKYPNKDHKKASSDRPITNSRIAVLSVFDALKFSCPMCDNFKTTSKQTMIVHLMDKEINYRPYKCKECVYNACTVSELRKHFNNTNHGNAETKIEKLSNSDQENELERLVEKSLVKDDEDDEDTGNVSPEHLLSVDGTTISKKLLLNRKSNGSYQCLTCAHVTSSWPKIKIHYLRHGFKRFGCSYCNLMFYLSGEATKHIRDRHPGKREDIYPLAVVLQGERTTYFKETQID